MKQRGKADGKPLKAGRRKATAPKRPSAPKPGRSNKSAAAHEEVERLRRERDEALRQQIATNEVMSIIRRSPADAQPVFDAIVESAARLCDAIFSVVYRYDDDRLQIAATKNWSAEATSQLRTRLEQKRPDRSNIGGRAILDASIVHVQDVLEDAEYSREFAIAGGWRAVLAVPLLHEGKSVGAITVPHHFPISKSSCSRPLPTKRLLRSRT